MVKLDEKLDAFMRRETVSTLAVPIDEKGTVHIAALRCMASTDPLAIYYITSVSSEKCGLLKNVGTLQAACDMGGHIDPEMYVQMRGTLRLWQITEKQVIVDQYFKHIGRLDASREGDDSVLLEFTPEYLKYTDYEKGWDKHIVKL